MQAYWLSFARDGRPSPAAGSSDPPWPAARFGILCEPAVGYSRVPQGTQARRLVRPAVAVARGAVLCSLSYHSSVVAWLRRAALVAMVTGPRSYIMQSCSGDSEAVMIRRP
jgi:hypothetical protein